MKKTILFIIMITAFLMAQTKGGAGSNNDIDYSGKKVIAAELEVVNAIDEFSTDDTMGGDSDTAIPTEQAVKAYVDGSVIAALTEEQVTDFVGAMVAGNTETGIVVTFQDGDNTIDFAIIGNLDWITDDEDTPTVADSMTFFDETGNHYNRMVIADLYVLSHDSFADWVGNKHLDWTGSVGTIHTGNYIEDDDTGVAEVYTNADGDWDGDTDSPQKNDLRDYLMLLDTNADGDVDNIDATYLATVETDPKVDTHAEIEAILTNGDMEWGTGDVALTELSIGTLLTYEPNGASNGATAYANDAEIAVTNVLLRVAGDGGPVVLDAADAVADGAYDGQLVIIQGTDDTNLVTIFDNVNTQLAGGVNMVLGDKDVLALSWDSNQNDWIELYRSDN